MTDEQPYSSARPYTCRSCEGLMRTRGIDGLCSSCHQPPPVRCERCARVRYGSGDWQDHPGRIPGERAGMCARCGEEKREEVRRRYYAGVRRTVRRQQHREPWAEGTTPADVWEGLREGDK